MWILLQVKRAVSKNGDDRKVPLGKTRMGVGNLREQGTAAAMYVLRIVTYEETEGLRSVYMGDYPVFLDCLELYANRESKGPEQNGVARR